MYSTKHIAAQVTPSRSLVRPNALRSWRLSISSRTCVIRADFSEPGETRFGARPSVWKFHRLPQLDARSIA